MEGPPLGLREFVSYRSAEAREAPDEEAEAALDGILDEILGALELGLRIGEDAPGDTEEEQGEALLAVVDEWASLATHAVASVYAPNSPFPRNLAGWGKGATKRLRWIGRLLARPLSRVKAKLGATSYSISVGFPWGISIGLSW